MPTITTTERGSEEEREVKMMVFDLCACARDVVLLKDDDGARECSRVAY